MIVVDWRAAVVGGPVAEELLNYAGREQKQPAAGVPANGGASQACSSSGAGGGLDKSGS